MATPREELTTKRLENLQPALPRQRYEISDTHVIGLRVRVSDSEVQEGDRRRKGKAAQVSFVLLARYSAGASPTRRTLGTFPEISLSEAREKAISWKGLIRRGIDPAEELRTLRAEAERQRVRRRTLADVLDQYENDKLAELRRGKATRRALDGKAGLLRDLLDHEFGSIQRGDILEAVRRRKASSPVSANRQLAYAKAFFNWCVEQDLLSASPAEKIKKPSKENQRDRHHSIDELREIWAAAGDLGYPFGPLVRLMVVLPMRREEIAAMPISELQLGEEGVGETWTLPAGRTKRANALRIPLSPLARAIIKGAIDSKARPEGSPYVFSTTGETSVSGFAKAKRRLDKKISEKREEAARTTGVEAESMPHWTLHDLRTTFTTIACEELGIDAAVADRILNHVASATTSKIMRTYNKSELFEARAAALAAWALLIQNQIVAGPSNVIQIGKASRA